MTTGDIGPLDLTCSLIFFVKKGMHMKRLLLLSIAFLGLWDCGVRADIALLTSNPPGTPLSMDAGTTSSSMLVSVVSDDPTQDVMSAWFFSLEIVPDVGATGTLMFEEPSSATPANPSNYVFDGNGLGIFASNGGNQLSANDFFDISVGPGASVPGAPGANLLSMNFVASPTAMGLFGIYALRGAADTQWTDGNATTQFFSNVPDGTGLVRIGEVLVIPTVPEPNTLTLVGLGVGVLAGWRLRRSRNQQDSVESNQLCG